MRASGCRRGSRRRSPSSSPTSSRACRRWSSARRSAGRCSTASAGPDKDEVRRIALDLAGVVGRGPAHAARQLRLDGARAAGPRSTSTRTRRAGCGVSSAHPGRVLNAAVTGLSRDAGARRHLPGQRRRARHRRAAGLVRDADARCRLPRPSGRMVPLSQFATFDRGAGVPARLAARPRADADRARGRQPGRAAGRRGRCTSTPTIDAFDAKLPTPYTVETGGLYEESARVAARRCSRSCRS